MNLGASSAVEDEKNTIKGYPKIWTLIVGKVDEGRRRRRPFSLKNEKRTVTDNENNIGKPVRYCYNVNYTAESSFVALNHGWQSSNFSATSAENSASLGGCMKRFRDQWSGGLQRRPRAHTPLIQDFLRATLAGKKRPPNLEGNPRKQNTNLVGLRGHRSRPR